MLLKDTKMGWIWATKSKDSLFEETVHLPTNALSLRCCLDASLTPRT